MKLIRDVNRVTDTTVLIIGVSAGVLTSIFLFALDLVGWNHVSFALLLGELLSGRTDTFGLRIGFSAYLVASAVIAYLYSLVFRSAHRSGVAVGLHVALFQWIILGLLLAIVPWTTRTIHPSVTVYMQPGPFALWDGIQTAITFFWTQLFFGAAVGFMFDRAAIGFDHPRPIAPDRLSQRELSRSQRVSGTIRV